MFERNEFDIYLLSIFTYITIVYFKTDFKKQYIFFFHE